VPLQYPLPLPKGGREGAATNPILREDQLSLKQGANRGPRTRGVSASARTVLYCMPAQSLKGVLY